MLLTENDLTEFAVACTRIANANRLVTSGHPALSKLEDRLDAILQQIGPVAVIIMALCIERHLNQVALPTLRAASELDDENNWIIQNIPAC